MQPKKNDKVDLSKNSGLYFAIGLALILFISWQAIEWKTYDKDLYGYEALNVDEEDDEDIPITEQLKTPPPPPPPPPPAPEVIEVVEDEEEVEETVIESTETNEEEIVEIVEVEEEFEEVDVPFAVIEDVPIFPGFEKLDKSKIAEKTNKINKKPSVAILVQDVVDRDILNGDGDTVNIPAGLITINNLVSV